MIQQLKCGTRVARCDHTCDARQDIGYIDFDEPEMCTGIKKGDTYHYKAIIDKSNNKLYTYKSCLSCEAYCIDNEVWLNGDY